ncbi:NAD regulator [Brevundimonas intermedia]|uniref:NAD regulator n=1 Tax=Brevundimonas intermedia TaxID=74315 RepID=A0ABQ5TBY2_9CAUL|nr:NAD regulator [Brevundimonas intermedia]GLK50347.1 NAD regulator [Brevundimonas intermedia]
MTGAADQGVRIGLSVVVMALKDRRSVVLTTQGEDGARALPFGPFDPVRDRTFELALRDFVTEQTGFRLGFVEQLYTFGDAGRATPRATPAVDQRREVSVGYLALTPDAAEVQTEAQTHDARWDAAFDIFPWEDRRTANPALRNALSQGLALWAGDNDQRQARARALFALTPDHRWNEERVLERYELLYEARLVAEAWRDGDQPPPPSVLPGMTMASDHRRILATGLGRLRSKLKYRPVLFDLTPGVFTLSALQAAAEAVSGLTLHKQNFRRGVERTGLVEPTGQLSSATGGRPAELFRFKGVDPQTGAAPGLSLPAQR